MAFTYEVPDERKFLAGVLQILQTRRESIDETILQLLTGATCSIVHSSKFSEKRWDAFHTEVHFYVPLSIFANVLPEHRRRLKSICELIMPKMAGLDIMAVEFAPSLESVEPLESSLMDDLQKIKQATGNVNFEILPQDIIDKGKMMSEVYVYLYCIENTLRLFIEKVCTEKHGKDFISKINIPSGVKRSIAARKLVETSNKWISLRGNSDLYYLDFKELGALINNNQELKDYFPDEHWLNVKIEELGNCRNLVAHNSYVGETEKNILKLYYKQILSQTQSAFQPKNDNQFQSGF